MADAAAAAGNGRPLALRRLGRSGIDVSVIGFGCAPLGELYGRIDERVARATFRAACAAGVTLFDVAPLYGHGLAEHRLGGMLREVGRDSVVLSTKVGRYMAPREPGGAMSGYAGGFPHRAIIDYSRDGALRSIDQSLLRLGTHRIDIALIHDVDVHTHGAAAVDERFAEAMDGAYPALVELKRAGVVRAIGVGVNEAAMAARFARAGDFDCMLVAGRYTLLEQGALDDFLPLAAAKGIGVMLGGVFNSGILATGPVPGAKYDYRDAPPDVLERARGIAGICRGYGVSLPTAALHFPLAHDAVSSLVLGAVAPAEIERNVAALAAPLPRGLWSALAASHLVRGDAPMPRC